MSIFKFYENLLNLTESDLSKIGFVVASYFLLSFLIGVIGMILTSFREEGDLSFASKLGFYLIISGLFICLIIFLLSLTIYFASKIFV